MATRHAQLRDSTRRRNADAVRPYRAALERFGEGRRLWFYTVPLHLPPGTALHSEEASRAARLVVETLCGSAPARWKLERGRGGALHLHIVTPLPPVAVVGFEHVCPVYDLRGLLDYLAKPPDARLCRPGRLTPWSPNVMTRRREMFTALDEQAAARRDRLARGKRTLPPVQGWTGTVMKSGRCDAPAVFLLACRLHVLALAALLAAGALVSADPIPTPRPAHRERPRPAQRGPRPRAPDRPLSGSRV